MKNISDANSLVPIDDISRHLTDCDKSNSIEFVSENRVDELSKEIMSKYHSAFERLVD
jgi:hypothetical protein